MAKKSKKTLGRPSKYDPKFPSKLIKFFDIEPYIDKELEHFGKDGEVKWVDYKRMANKLPTVRNFCKLIKISYETFYQWITKKKDKKKNPYFKKEFSDAFTQAKDLQKWFLIENGLNNCYNPAFAIFVAKNITDMTDKTDITTDGEKIVGPIIYLPKKNE